MCGRHDDAWRLARLNLQGMRGFRPAHKTVTAFPYIALPPEGLLASSVLALWTLAPIYTYTCQYVFCGHILLRVRRNAATQAITAAIAVE